VVERSPSTVVPLGPTTDSRVWVPDVIFGVMQNTTTIDCRITRRLVKAVAGAFLLAVMPTLGAGLGAQQPTDSARADSSSAQRLATVRVEVTRGGSATTDRLPWAVGAQSTEQVRRGQATLGIDEALANIPGVVVANRYNYALDQRVSIRGAGARANFGLRGVKVLLDGVPQSLPDGQSQLTNVDLGALSRVEVLRGSASSLYGNGSGGVISFTTDLSSPHTFGATIRQTSGSFGLQKSQVRLAGRRGSSIGAVSASRTTLDGFRQYSRADTRQLLAALDHAFGESLTLSLRTGAAETPHALNPGALTAAEYAVNPDSAAATNVNRGASREVSQRYASVRLQRRGPGVEWNVAAYGQRRFVDNALAVAPPAPAGPTNGTFSTLNRKVFGSRIDASVTSTVLRNLRIAGGLDAQRSFDVRRNQRSTAGRPSAPEDTLLLDQDEIVFSVGPFAQAQWDPHPDVTASAGARWDRLQFRVDDHFTGDGDDDSGERSMVATSGHIGLVWRATAALAPYANVSTAFETPTTTELQVRPDGGGGFNPDLGPQRIRTIEAGVRGSLGARVAFEVAFFDADASDAIVQFLETDGRAFFRNAGTTDSHGAEVGVTAQPLTWLGVQAAWTWAEYRFSEYRIVNGLVVDTLDGNYLAGVPRNAVRLGARARFGAATVDVDHSVQSALYGDDRNTVRVDGWGAGQLNIRAAWTGRWNGWRAEPFISVQNVLDESYIGSVTLNGFGGRVLEPAARRNWYIGLELAAPIIR
jgi:iron complex outermembrane receptor protein